MQNHIIKSHGICIIHSQSDHRQTISDKNHIHSGAIGDECRGEIMGGEHGDGFMLFVHVA
jgi:hypothetical protein